MSDETKPEEIVQPGPDGGVSVPAGVNVPASELAPHADEGGMVKVTEVRGVAPAGAAEAAVKPQPRALSEEAEQAGRQTVEHWAAKKGMLHLQEQVAPRVIKNARPGSGPLAVDMKRSGIRMPRVNAKHADFLAAKVALGWPEGHELTEAEFDAAIAKHGAAAAICH